MSRLSSPAQQIKPSYDVIVIGSGYGGAIAASRLARAGKTVCVLERGKERQAGEFPNTSLDGAADMQFDLPECHQGSRTGMFDFHVNKDISVLVGCGLGGTSLINANVSLRADPRVFEDARWPAALRAEQGRRLAAGYQLAEQMLGANPYPADGTPLPKLSALEASAKAMGKKFYRPPINVTFADGYNQAGVWQHKCTLCGDCVSGCNNGSKNSVLMNYLPDAKRHGAKIFVETSVRWVERRADGKWAVHYQLVNTGRESFAAPTLFVCADIVILAAGSLGSTEILLRSRDAGKLTISRQVGSGFSGNGDALGFGYNCTSEIRSLGLGQKAPDNRVPLDAQRAIGPCITGVIDMRGNPDLRDDFIIEEGTPPGVAALVLPHSQCVGSAAMGINTAPDKAARQLAAELETAALGAYHGATLRTQSYLAMGHDGSDGTMSLASDRLRISWPGVGAKPVFTKIQSAMIDATRAHAGISTANPIWNDAFGKSLITVHPLGGCNMADSAAGGGVDHTCKVFSSSTGTDVHHGLYVCDGAVVPTSVGVNPLLTISALAERCCALIAEERGWVIDYSAKGPIPAAEEPRTVGVRFTETMKGWFSAAPDGNYAAAAARGKEQGSAFQFILTIAAEDADALATNSDHQARMVGTVTAPALSPAPLIVTQGVFNLFVEDPSLPGGRLMKYRMVCTANDGRSFFFSGFKTIKKGPFWQGWHDTTTLYITLHQGATEDGPILGKGVLEIAPDDFVRQLATMEAINATSNAERRRALVTFGRYFAGSVYDYYGGIAAPPAFEGALAFGEEAEAPPRKRRPLRVPAPAFVPINAVDGAQLLLTRYTGGTKGPVLLAHGLGASSRELATDSIGTNLLEYLYAHGYDVWLFDQRGSIMLPESSTTQTVDDAAHKDWPAAVGKVREVTGAASVQVVAHCLGAATFTMAMLAGLQGVRSAVCSQLGTHFITPDFSLLWSGLQAPQLPAALGFSSLHEAAAGNKGWVEHLHQRALTRASAKSRPTCESDLCEQLTFMYGPLYEHTQLEADTHASLYELYGETSVELIQSVSTLVRVGHLVNAAGEETYLSQLGRLAIPIRFIHGAENRCFLPASTEATVQLLSAHNGPDLYSRAVIAGYGHGDCIFGKTASIDVYPYILEHLTKT